MRKGDAETGKAKRFNGSDEVAKIARAAVRGVAHVKREINCVHAAHRKGGVVHERGQRMHDGIANDSVDASAAGGAKPGWPFAVVFVASLRVASAGRGRNAGGSAAGPRRARGRLRGKNAIEKIDALHSLERKLAGSRRASHCGVGECAAFPQSEYAGGGVFGGPHCDGRARAGSAGASEGRYSHGHGHDIAALGNHGKQAACAGERTADSGNLNRVSSAAAQASDELR